MRKLGSIASSRASFYLYNTEEEIAALVAVIKEAVSFFR
jgi:selenocysteine lyase/cysteine desulfurase